MNLCHNSDCNLAPIGPLINGSNDRPNNVSVSTQRAFYLQTYKRNK